MVYIRNALAAFKAHPQFVAMRLLARFDMARALAVRLRRVWRGRSLASYLQAESRRTSDFFPDVDREAVVATLESDGVAFGLNLRSARGRGVSRILGPPRRVGEPQPRAGVRTPSALGSAGRAGRNILLAQYFNVLRDCAVARRIANDPVLRWIAAQYLGTVPRLIGANLWWSYPVASTAEELSDAAQMYHYDLDDFKFVKFFFYLTRVGAGTGPHLVVRGSHRRKVFRRSVDRLLVRRYTDQEIADLYPGEQIIAIVGPPGTGFAEDTLAIHKGMAPSDGSRLTFQVQFAIHDFGNQSDEADAASLKLIPGI